MIGKLKYPILHGVGAAAFAWWWTHRQQQRAAGAHHSFGRGEVIFSNTPHPFEG